MTKQQVQQTIMTPDVRLLRVDLQETAKFKNPETGELEDSGNYGVKAYFNKSDSSYHPLYRALENATTAQFPQGAPQNLSYAFKESPPNDDRFPNTIQFTAKTRFIDRVSFLDENQEPSDASIFYAGCWVRLAITPAIVFNKFNNAFQRWYLNGIAFVCDDEPLVSKFSYDEMRAMLNANKPQNPPSSNNVW